MKRALLYTVVLLLTASCGPKLYTHPSYFNCATSNDFELDTDRKKIIYHLLEKAVVVDRDIPDYGLHKNKKQFYLLNAEVIEKTDAPFFKYIPFQKREMPTQINDVNFCWKTKDELQSIANETNDFLYLYIKDLKINGDEATVQLNNTWLVSKKNEGKYLIMSGGGYQLFLKKVDGNWVIDQNAPVRRWIS